jgi:hypothetical protein
MRNAMEPSSLSESFAIYLWRSPQAPGTLYLAKGFSTAEALCRSLVEYGYIVKVVHSATDTEYEIQEGALRPISHGNRPAFAYPAQFHKPAASQNQLLKRLS